MILDNEKSRRSSVQSVEIGMRVLLALGDLDHAATLGAVAQASGLPPPQAHRYLQSLITMGMARQDPASGRYLLGPNTLRLGLAALARTDAFRIADETIRSFVEDRGRAVQISALGPSGPTVVRLYSGSPQVVMSLKVGSVLPLLHSATGHVFATFAGAAEVAGLIALEAERTQDAHAVLAEIRRKVAAAGFAQDDGHLIPGLRATAFPIFDAQGEAVLVAAMVAAKAAARIDDDQAVMELRSRCETISRELGWRAD
ncbi:MAG TPA: IclR family transcriptional regulator [Sphingobium sp.]|nr:IclR family transcriptional regulator [Sphingobium sp.]